MFPSETIPEIIADFHIAKKLTPKRWHPTGFHQTMELLFSILIIGICCAIGIPMYVQYREMAHITHFAGYRTALEQAHIYHSVTGNWPTSIEQLGGTGFSASLSDKTSEHYIRQFNVSDGAVHFTFAGELEGKTLSLRPAVPSNDGFGPVIWIAGKGLNRNGWTMSGTDKTDIDPVLINRFLK